MSVSALRAYQIYVSVKLHMTKDEYDAVRYGFKNSCSESSFLKRRDASYFYKVIKKYPSENALIKFYAANMIAGHDWIGDMLANDPDVMLEWGGRIESRTFIFNKQVKKLLSQETSFEETFIGTATTKPKIVTSYLEGDLSAENFAIIETLMGIIDRMDFSDLLWDEQKVMIKKYSTFLPHKREKFFKLLSQAVADAYN